MGIRSRAQNFEDVMLWRALRDVEAGFFIDVGAQHPIKDSVSKIFSERGWDGIHIEPIPEFSDMLRADRPNETVIAAVVSEKPGAMTFFDIAGTGLSTGRRDIAEAHAAAGYPYREIAVPTLSLDHLLTLAPSDDIHWLKIDVEGMEREVLESWRTSLRRPWIIVIEANFPGSRTPSHESWEGLILEKGYHCAYYDGLNRFYISAERRVLENHFTLPPNIFDGFQLDPLSDHAIIIQQLHQGEIEALERTVKTLNAHLADIVARERAGAIEAAADKARLEQQVAALQIALQSDRAIAWAREENLFGLLDDLRAVAASETRTRLKASAQEVKMRVELKARQDAVAQQKVDTTEAGGSDVRLLEHVAVTKVAALERDLAYARQRIKSLRKAMAKQERELLAQMRMRP